MLYNILYFLIIIFSLKIIFFKFSSFLNLIDYPSQRKRHQGKIPLTGGLTIYFSLFITSFFFNFNFWIDVILYSAMVVLILGAIDDAKQVGVVIRLISQVTAGLIVIGSGLNIVDIGDYYYFPPISLGILGILITLISVVALTNAINFMDGIDGLASSLILISFISIIVNSYFNNQLIDVEIVWLIIISIVFFLLFNLNILKMGKIFLGDSGSTMLGFILGFLLIYYTHPSVRNFHPVLAAWCVALPIYDLCVVILRRIYRKINPFRPDRRHLHHLLIDKGFSDRKVLLIICFTSILLNLIGSFTFFTLGPLPCLLLYILFLFIYMILSFQIIRKI